TTSWDCTLRFWDPQTGRERQRQHAPAEDAVFLRLLPDGKAYLARNADQRLGLYDVDTGGQLAVLRGQKGYEDFALAPDRKTLAVVDSENKTVRLVDPATGGVRATLPGVGTGFMGLSFAPDSRTLVAWEGDRTVTVWDVAAGRKRRQFRGPSDWL